jgi:hypothetical protein
VVKVQQNPKIRRNPKIRIKRIKSQIINYFHSYQGVIVEMHFKVIKMLKNLQWFKRIDISRIRLTFINKVRFI